MIKGYDISNCRFAAFLTWYFNVMNCKIKCYANGIFSCINGKYRKCYLCLCWQNLISFSPAQNWIPSHEFCEWLYVLQESCETTQSHILNTLDSTIHSTFVSPLNLQIGITIRLQTNSPALFYRCCWLQRATEWTTGVCVTWTLKGPSGLQRLHLCTSHEAKNWGYINIKNNSPKN